MTDALSRILTYRGVPLWRDTRVLQVVAQVVSAIVVVSVLVFFVDNLLDAANRRGLKLGYGILSEEAGFPIGETTILEYDPSKSFRYAFVVGVLNTIKVALVGIVAATVLGVIVGVARLSSNWLVSKISSVYVEIFRNVPLLVQLFIWYFAVFQKLPKVKESIELPGPIYLNNRGVSMVWAVPSPSFWPWMIFLLAGVVLAITLWNLLTRRQLRTGKSTYPFTSAILALLLMPTLGWFLVGESPLIAEVPVLGRFSFEGGLILTPEFAALLVGLVAYTGSYIAEVVRAGVQSVQRGQVEAAQSLGLGEFLTLRLVIFPQALRVIIPPLISQYLNLTKNSSLAIAIGYPDLFSVGRIMINQAGRAVPIIAMIMGTYLVMSLTYALVGNIYNRRVRFVER